VIFNVRLVCFLPVIPSNDDGRLVFNLLPKEKIVVASLEFKLALEKGYKITRIYNCYKYKPLRGLFQRYVEKTANIIQLKNARLLMKVLKDKA